MLTNLSIKNFALIENIAVQFKDQLSIITGETGAGKSVLLGALGLVLGKRADSTTLKDSSKKCIIEAQFTIGNYNLKPFFEEEDLDYEEETFIRREILPSGKSRAFINDTPVNLEVMKTVGNFLVDIHSQRDTYLLGASTYQLRMIDGYAQNQDLVAAYKLIFKEYKQQEFEYNSLKQHAEELNKEADYNHFLLEELEAAAINSGELENLEEELKIIEHAEEIKGKLFECQELLENSEFSINSGLQLVAKNIEQISNIVEHFEPLKTRLESCFHELKDIAKEIEDESHKVDFDKERQETIQDRIGLIYQLLQKHHTNDEMELLEIRSTLRAKADKVLNMDDDLSKAKKLYDKLESELIIAGDKLANSRKEVFEGFKNELELLLKELAMPHATISIQHDPIISPSENGMDKITILFSANAGIPPAELKNVASGGEFSRLMFCIKYILAGKTSLPTIIFDEIDTGISGEIAINMVRMMKEMASRHQVISITHLPQIAASGDEHYFVYKESLNGKSISKIKKLGPEDRVSEIAKMIGGDHPSDAALESARELLRM